LAQLHRKQAENAPFKASQNAFVELSRAARNNKKRRIRDLVTKSLEGLDEFVPIEIKFSVQGEEVIISLGTEEGYCTCHRKKQHSVFWWPRTLV